MKNYNDYYIEEKFPNIFKINNDIKEADIFWYDRCKKLRDNPRKRLLLSIKNLPLPAAFKESAIATRALIKEKRKNNEEQQEELELLYWLSAINSFHKPYSHKAETPGYNIIKMITFDKIKILNFSYKNLGYKYLDLLNKTDIRWIVESWGEPENHTTLNDIHIQLWERYEEIFKEKRDNGLLGALGL